MILVGVCKSEGQPDNLSGGGRVQRGGFSGLQSSSGGSGGPMNSPPLAGRRRLRSSLPTLPPSFPPSEPAARASSKCLAPLSPVTVSMNIQST